MLEERAAGIVSLLGDATRALDAEIGTRLEGIENTLAERGQSLIGHFETRVDALDTGTERLNAALEARARQINDTLVERAREIAATFAEGKDGVAEMIDQRATRVRSDINDMVEFAATMIDGRVSHFSEQMEASRTTLSRALDTILERLTQARVEIDASAGPEEARLLGETGNRGSFLPSRTSCRDWQTSASRSKPRSEAMSTSWPWAALALSRLWMRTPTAWTNCGG